MNERGGEGNQKQKKKKTPHQNGAKTIPSSVCGYSDEFLDVAFHIRRGDVLPGPPENITRCGVPVYSEAARANNHELSDPFFSKNWAKRGNDMRYYESLPSNRNSCDCGNFASSSYPES